MTLLCTADYLRTRRAVASGGLAPLADSLSADLDPVLSARIQVPREKALYSRAGGYCQRDGAELTFDPWSPDVHRCPMCGTLYRDEFRHRWWIFPHQLWLAERVVHAATLFALRGETRHSDFAVGILEQYADAYLAYPNCDNVLGPTRPFFSTYLESIWLLELCVALDLLEDAGDTRASGRVRDRIIEPSVALIGGFNERMSNRQVWNDAALMAGHRLLGAHFEPGSVASWSRGLSQHLRRGLLEDGTWYEGENYHQFAHRGLWYGVHLAASLGFPLEREELARFNKGFAATFATVRPDLTLPARKDSKYGTSLRQWRFAEMCELGLARTDDPDLRAMLARLYDPSVPCGDTGRATSSAESERNHPAVGLSRADLGWKSLLFANEYLPAAESERDTELKSLLLEGQGIAVFRRDHGRVFAALDYGQGGGGHGHADRLNLLLSVDDVHWLDDLGTGSYADASLFWYRSTLAHNAPLVDRGSQVWPDGTLDAYAEAEAQAVGWVRGMLPLSPDADAERTLVVMSSYAVDLLRWTDSLGTQHIALPVHCDGDLSGALEAEARRPHAAEPPPWPGELTLLQSLHARAGTRVSIEAHRSDEHTLRGEVFCSVDADWFTFSGPGQPASNTRRFHVVECEPVDAGWIATVWAWSSDIQKVECTEDAIVVIMANGERHEHRRDPAGWQVQITDTAGERHHFAPVPRPSAADALEAEDEELTDEELLAGDIRLLNLVTRSADIPLLRAKDVAEWWSDAPRKIREGYVHFELGKAEYRRAEESWEEAGRPTARVALCVSHRSLIIDVQVSVGEPRFVPADAENPYDNDPPEIHGDSIQLYVLAPMGEIQSVPDTGGAWTLVPEPDAPSGTVRARAIPGWGSAPLGATNWRRTATGYELRAEVLLPASPKLADQLDIDVLVNQSGPGRVRRRGQLVLSGARNEFVYLKSDSQPPPNLIPFIVDLP